MKKLVIFAILFLILSFSFISSVRLPTVGGDDDAWGTILNEFLNVSHNETGEIKSDAVLNFTSNLTLGQKIDFALGEIIDNLIDGWIRVNGNLNVTNNLSVVGNVGIGIINPSEKLEIVDGAIKVGYTADTFDELITFWRNNAQVGAIANTGSDLHILSKNNQDLILTDDSSNGITIKDGGNVGIGTTSPAGLLHVNGTTSELKIQGTSAVNPAILNITSSARTRIYLDGAGGTDTNQITFRTLGVDKFQIEHDNTNSKFYINNGSEVEIMTFMQTGNVGIGTTSPSGILTINASRFPSFVVEAPDGSDWFTVGDESGLVRFNSQGGRTEVGGAGNLGARMNIGSLSSTLKALSISGVVAQTANIFEVNSVGSLGGDYFVINGTNGFVGIGITNPSSQLTINSSGSGSAGGGFRFVSPSGNGRVNIYTATSSSGHSIIDMSNSSDAITTRIHTQGTSWVSLNANFGIGTDSPTRRLEIFNDQSSVPLQVTDSSGLCDFGVDGSGWVASGCASDANLKENIQNISDQDYNAIADFVIWYANNMKQYTWKSSGEESIGVIAQDLQVKYPEKVSLNEDGYLTVNPPTLTDSLITISNLNKKIIFLENNLTIVQNQLNKICTNNQDLCK